jgi:predicted adenine nucleotide alpha hydrolase (AANH) superfamily ATPase
MANPGGSAMYLTSAADASVENNQHLSKLSMEFIEEDVDKVTSDSASELEDDHEGSIRKKNSFDRRPLDYAKVILMRTQSVVSGAWYTVFLF